MSTNRKLHWEEVHCEGDLPAGRLGETLTTADDQRAVFMYGGMIEAPDQPAQYLDDFFVFDPTTSVWKNQAMSSPEDRPSITARAFHTTVSHHGKLYIFGGCSSAERHNDLIELDPETGRREVVVPSSPAECAPAPRYCHSAVVFDDAMYVFGGKYGTRNSNERLADIFKFDFRTNSWVHVEQRGEVPPARSAHSAVVCGRRMFVFGGRQSDNSWCGDLFEFAFDSCMWRRIPTADASYFERARHSAVLHNGVIAIFGGWNGRRKLNDLYLHAIDGSANEEAEPTEDTAPSRRECHAAVMWRNTMLVFSGRYRLGALNDVHSIRLGPPSLVEQCRDWLMSHGIAIEPSLLPDRLARRLKAWQQLHEASDPCSGTSMLAPAQSGSRS